jgi:hypothetical protein
MITTILMLGVKAQFMSPHLKRPKSMRNMMVETTIKIWAIFTAISSGISLIK